MEDSRRILSFGSEYTETGFLQVDKMVNEFKEKQKQGHQKDVDIRELVERWNEKSFYTDEEQIKTLLYIQKELLKFCNRKGFKFGCDVSSPKLGFIAKETGVIFGVDLFGCWEECGIVIPSFHGADGIRQLEVGCHSAPIYLQKKPNNDLDIVVLNSNMDYGILIDIYYYIIDIYKQKYHDVTIQTFFLDFQRQVDYSGCFEDAVELLMELQIKVPEESTLGSLMLQSVAKKENHKIDKLQYSLCKDLLRINKVSKHSSCYEEKEKTDYLKEYIESAILIGAEIFRDLDIRVGVLLSSHIQKYKVNRKIALSRPDLRHSTFEFPYFRAYPLNCVND